MDPQLLQHLSIAKHCKVVNVSKKDATAKGVRESSKMSWHCAAGTVLLLQ